MTSHAVIGGGVSGLAAARALARAGAAHVTVFEAADRFGGRILTADLGAGPVDLGPDQFLRRDPSVELWCRDLGLADSLVAPRVSTAGVYSYGQARELPRGLALGIPTDLAALGASGIVSPDGCQHAAHVTEGLPPLSLGELGLDQTDPDAERSAGAMLRERLGDEIVDRLVDPLLGGINAAGVDALSLGVAAPQVARALAGERDVVEALSTALPVAPPGDGPPRSPFLGLAGGLGRLVSSAVAELVSAGVELRGSAPVQALEPTGDPADPRILLSLESGEQIRADGVVLATPGPAAALLLQKLSPGAAAICAAVPYSSVVLTTFLLPAGQLDVRPEWSGVLVPRVEGFLTTAISFFSQKWEWLSGHRFEGHPVDVVRVSAGRHDDDRALEMADHELIGRLLSELGTIVGLRAQPLTSHVQRWEKAFPQYLPGHAGNIARLLAELGHRPSVTLAGALLGGIGVPACATSGAEAARRLVERASIRRS